MVFTCGFGKNDAHEALNSLEGWIVFLRMRSVLFCDGPDLCTGRSWYGKGFDRDTSSGGQRIGRRVLWVAVLATPR